MAVTWRPDGVALGRPAPIFVLCHGARAFQPFEPPPRRAYRASLLALIGFVGLCLLVSAVNGAMTARAVQGWYHALRRPVGTPPDWVFGPVWVVLYIAMGVAAWLVWRRVEVGLHRKRAALRLWGWQLLVNALWPAAFFTMHSPAMGQVVLAILLVLVMLTVRAFWPLQRSAAALLLPYLAWIGYAAWLNAGFWWLNAGSAMVML